MDQIREAAVYIKKGLKRSPEIGLVLGSGLGMLAEQLENRLVLPYHKIPNFPVVTVPGHAGNLVIGDLEGKRVVAMQGRFHYYEGYTMQQLTMPIRVMKLLGVESLLITNAAGGVNINFKPGDLMVISDHLNLMGDNPLRGENSAELGPRFPDMSRPYDQKMLELAEESAANLGINLRKGVYCALSGPNYETPAEIRFLRQNGVDAVGMSTVPEVLVARHMALRVLGISCITNMAAGVLPQPLSHQEVIETANRVKPRFTSLLRGVIAKL